MAGAGSYSGQNPDGAELLLRAGHSVPAGRVQDDPPGHASGPTRSPSCTCRRRPPQTTHRAIDAGAVGRVQGRTPIPGALPGKAEPAVRFQEGMSVLIYDDERSYDTVHDHERRRITALHLQHNMDDLSKSYGAGSKIVQASSSHTYYLGPTSPTKTYQLMHYDGGAQRRADRRQRRRPRVRVLRRSPAAAGEEVDCRSGWPVDDLRPAAPAAVGGRELCVHQRRIAGARRRRLPVLGPGGVTTTLVKLTQAQLTDGPWCPDATQPEPVRRRPVPDPEGRRAPPRADAATRRCAGRRARCSPTAARSRGGKRSGSFRDQEIRFAGDACANLESRSDDATRSPTRRTGWR